MTTFLDRLFANLHTRLSIRPTRAADRTAELAADISTDLHLTLAEIDRQHRLLAVRAERAASFVEDHSYDLPVLPEAEVMIAGLDSAHADIHRMRERGLGALTADERARHACTVAGWSEGPGGFWQPGLYAKGSENPELVQARAEIAGLREELAQTKATAENLRRALDLKNVTPAQRLDSQFAAISREVADALGYSQSDIDRLSAARLVHALIREYQDRRARAEQVDVLDQIKTAISLPPGGDVLAKIYEMVGRCEAQQLISRWAHDTFGECTVERAAQRAAEEMREFSDEISGFYEMSAEKRRRLLKEGADVVVCLYRMAQLMGENLHNEIDRVMKINHKREWVRDGKGCGYHVKPGTFSPDEIAAARSVSPVVASLMEHVKLCEACRREGQRDPKCPTCNRRERTEIGHADGFTPRTEVSEVGPAFFDDETETLPAHELHELRAKLFDLERWHGLLRESTERLTAAALGSTAGKTVLDHIGTPEFDRMVEETQRRTAGNELLTCLQTAIRTDLLPVLVDDGLSPDPALSIRANLDPLGAVHVIESAARLLCTYQTVRREDRAALDGYARTVTALESARPPPTE